MFDSSSYVNPTPLAHADTSRDVLSRGELGWSNGENFDSSVALKSKNQEINRLQLAVKLPWAIFFESVDILS
ncbi:hypothetical protein TNCV_4342171 [Trichonephila clavipes]|nr:hypothetical protein TNCV_4342171 [Trichonephila clavipes]